MNAIGKYTNLVVIKDLNLFQRVDSQLLPNDYAEQLHAPSHLHLSAERGHSSLLNGQG